ncbi:MAG TPA: methyltransferase domain-containing protein [Solirubrobacteraceae bacterium]|nr:methyltransferase domain-containing protein [Solirubrobacteraceae bacterium]
MSASDPNGDGPAQNGPADVDPAVDGTVRFDANAHREASLRGWEAAASGWRRRQGVIRRLSAPVSEWLLEAIAPQPGQRILELAAGTGETGLLAAQRVGPAGGVIVSDQAEAMLDGARARATELSVENVEFKVISAEWIDMPLASVDGVLCRWGYMLLADPSAALAETRRVLRSGGRLALAVWDAVQHNQWALQPALELIERGLTPAPGAGPDWQPGPFALGDKERVRELLAGAGFAEIDVQALDLSQRYDSFEDFWETTLDISNAFHDAVLSRAEVEIDEIRAGLATRLRPFTAADGTLSIPARTLVASASA